MSQNNQTHFHYWLKIRCDMLNVIICYIYLQSLVIYQHQSVLYNQLTPYLLKSGICQWGELLDLMHNNIRLLVIKNSDHFWIVLNCLC